MKNSTVLTLSDGQDRIFMCCRKLDDFEAFLSTVSEHDHVSFPALNDKCRELRNWADPINAKLHQETTDLAQPLDSKIKVQIESIENVLVVFEEKLTEVIASKGPEYLERVFGDEKSA